MLTSRRSFLGGLIAAPAVVAVGNIMPVRAIERLLTPARTVLHGSVTFYVDPTGVVTASNTFRTIQAAVDAALTAEVVPGGQITIQLRDGVYTSNGYLQPVRVPPNAGFLVSDGDMAFVRQDLTFESGARSLPCFHAKNGGVMDIQGVTIRIPEWETNTYLAENERASDARRA